METYDNTQQQLFKETEIESRISMEKPAFNKKKAIFHQQI
jgi:hypothetical protein